MNFKIILIITSQEHHRDSTQKKCTSLLSFLFFASVSCDAYKKLQKHAISFHDNNIHFCASPIYTRDGEHHMKKHDKTFPVPQHRQRLAKSHTIPTSLECNLGDISVCSPDELNVHWNVSAGGEASTSQRNCTVSCFNAPNNSSLSLKQTGASAKATKNIFVWCV